LRIRAFRVNDRADARRRRDSYNVSRVLGPNTPPAVAPDSSGTHALSFRSSSFSSFFLLALLENADIM